MLPCCLVPDLLLVTWISLWLSLWILFADRRLRRVLEYSSALPSISIYALPVFLTMSINKSLHMDPHASRLVGSVTTTLSYKVFFSFQLHCWTSVLDSRLAFNGGSRLFSLSHPPLFFLPACFCCLVSYLLKRLSLHGSPNWKIMDLINWSLGAIDTIFSRRSLGSGEPVRISTFSAPW